MSRRRTPLTYANVASTLALVFALSGGAYAAATLPAKSVGVKQLKANSVTSAKIADGTIALGDLNTATALALKGQKGDVGPKGDKGDPGPLVTPEAWHEVGAAGEVAFNAGSTNAHGLWICSGPDPQPSDCPSYNTVGFYKDPFGVVHLKGTLKLGGSSIAFTLPAGYRPAAVAVFPIAVSNTSAHATAVIDAAGELYVDLQPAGSSGTEIYSLDGITFRSGA